MTPKELVEILKEYGFSDLIKYDKIGVATNYELSYGVRCALKKKERKN